MKTLIVVIISILYSNFLIAQSKINFEQIYSGNGIVKYKFLYDAKVYYLKFQKQTDGLDSFYLYNENNKVILNEKIDVGIFLHLNSALNNSSALTIFIETGSNRLMLNKIIFGKRITFIKAKQPLTKQELEKYYKETVGSK